MKNQSLLVLLVRLVLVAVVLVPLALGAAAFKGMISDMEQQMIERTSIPAAAAR